MGYQQDQQQISAARHRQRNDRGIDHRDAQKVPTVPNPMSQCNPCARDLLADFTPCLTASCFADT